MTNFLKEIINTANSLGLSIDFDVLENSIEATQSELKNKLKELDEMRELISQYNLTNALNALRAELKRMK